MTATSTPAPTLRDPSRSRESRIQGVLRRRKERIRSRLDQIRGVCRVSGHGVTVSDQARLNEFLEELLFEGDREMLEVARRLGCPALEEGVVRTIAASDPTDCGTYVDWLTAQWLDDRWRIEDAARLRDDLVLFDRNRHRLDAARGRDITAYASPQALLAAVRPFRRNRTDNPLRDRPDMLEPPHARVLRDDDRFHVVMPLTPEAAAFWGDGSEWCVTWGVPGSRYPERSSRFEHYARRGPLLFVTHRGDGSIWAVHLEPGRLTLWDADDACMDDPLPRLAGLVGEEWSGFLQGEVLDLVGIADACAHTLLRIATAPDRDERLVSRVLGILERPYALLEWPDADPLERRLAIEVSPGIVAEMPDLTWAERRLAISLCPRMVREVPHPTEAERIEAIRADPGIFTLLRNPTPAERRAVIETRPLSILGIDDPTGEELELAASAGGMAGFMLSHYGVQPRDGADPDREVEDFFAALLGDEKRRIDAAAVAVRSA